MKPMGRKRKLQKVGIRCLRVRTATVAMSLDIGLWSANWHARNALPLLRQSRSDPTSVTVRWETGETKGGETELAEGNGKL